MVAQVRVFLAGLDWSTRMRFWGQLWDHLSETGGVIRIEDREPRHVKLSTMGVSDEDFFLIFSETERYGAEYSPM